MGDYLVWFGEHLVGRSKWSLSTEAWLYLLWFSLVFFLKIGDLNPIFYYFYRYVFLFTFYFHWFILSVVNFTLLALCYHMNNGIRHLLWDLGFFLELSKVYTSRIIMLFYAASLIVLNIIRFYLSWAQSMILANSLEAKKKFFFRFYLPRRPKGAGCRPFLPHVHRSDLYKVDNPEMGH
jgi:succinate dehydrogenase/fumarate reductase cytochrome b subunit